MKPARPLSRWLKALKAVLALAWGGLRAPFIGNPFAPNGIRVIRRWHARACRAHGLTVTAHGTPASGALYACNHISWLDIPLLGSQIDGVRFLSKSEVRGWPVIGWLAGKSATLFIQRGNGQQDATRQIADALRDGHGVMLFAEGTTTNGLTLRRFHARLLQAAIEAGAPVQPVAIRYLDADGQPNPRVAYVDDESFMDTFWRIVAEEGLRAEVHFLPPITPDGLSRSEIATRAHRAVAHALDLDGEETP